MDNHIQLFEHNEIRSVWHDEQEEWLFSIIDVVRALTGSNNPRRYWSDLKRKIAQEGGELNCTKKSYSSNYKPQMERSVKPM